MYDDRIIAILRYNEAIHGSDKETSSLHFFTITQL